LSSLLSLWSSPDPPQESSSSFSSEDKPLAAFDCLGSPPPEVLLGFVDKPVSVSDFLGSASPEMLLGLVDEPVSVSDF
jgi:hypothetical protein